MSATESRWVANRRRRPPVYVPSISQSYEDMPDATPEEEAEMAALEAQAEDLALILEQRITSLADATRALRLTFGVNAGVEVQVALRHYVGDREPRAKFAAWNGKRWFDGHSLDAVIRDAIAHGQGLRNDADIAQQAIAGLPQHSAETMTPAEAATPVA